MRACHQCGTVVGVYGGICDECAAENRAAHRKHKHCEDCGACMGDIAGFCDACQAAEDAKFAPRVA